MRLHRNSMVAKEDRQYKNATCGCMCQYVSGRTCNDMHVQLWRCTSRRGQPICHHFSLRLASTCVMSFEPSPMHMPNLEGRFRGYRSEGTVFPAAGAQRLHFFSAAIAAHNSVETFHWTFGRGHDTGASLAKSSALQHRQAWSLGSASARLLRFLRTHHAASGRSARRKRPGQWAPCHCLGCSSEPSKAADFHCL